MSIRTNDGVGMSASQGRDKSGSYKYIGVPLPKVDAYGKVTGRALYADDIMLPRIVYGRLFRPPHEHARILSLNTSTDLQIPRVLAMLIGEEFTQKFGILYYSQD